MTNEIANSKAATTETTIITVTLKDACGRYLEHLKTIGKKSSTLGTTRRSLNLLIVDMGKAKEVGKILPLHVDKFFKSEAATMQPGKSGIKPRAKASVLQIRRIVRSALVWWHEQGYSKNVALPKGERKFLVTNNKKITTVEKQKQEKSKQKKDKTEKGKSEKAWSGFDDKKEAAAQQGKTVATMHLTGKE